MERGELGRKTGIGWYRYDEEGKKLRPADRPVCLKNNFKYGCE